MLFDNDRVVDQNLTTAHILSDFNSAQRKAFQVVDAQTIYYSK